MLINSINSLRDVVLIGPKHALMTVITGLTFNKWQIQIILLCVSDYLKSQQPIWYSMTMSQGNSMLCMLCPRGVWLLPKWDKKKSMHASSSLSYSLKYNSVFRLKYSATLGGSLFLDVCVTHTWEVWHFHQLCFLSYLLHVARLQCSASFAWPIWEKKVPGGSYLTDAYIISLPAYRP